VSLAAEKAAENQGHEVGKTPLSLLGTQNTLQTQVKTI
jgi:hypothetical protein